MAITVTYGRGRTYSSTDLTKLRSNKPTDSPVVGRRRSTRVSVLSRRSFKSSSRGLSASSRSLGGSSRSLELSKLQKQQTEEEIMSLTIEDVVRKFLFDAIALVSSKSGVVDRLFPSMAIFAFGLPFVGADDTFDACHTAMEIVELGKTYSKELRALYRSKFGSEEAEHLLPKMEISCAIHTAEVQQSVHEETLTHGYTIPDKSIELALEFANACSYYGTSLVLTPSAKNQLLEDMNEDKDGVHLRELDWVVPEVTRRKMEIIELVALEEMGNHNRDYVSRHSRRSKSTWRFR